MLRVKVQGSVAERVKNTVGRPVWLHSSLGEGRAGAVVTAEFIQKATLSLFHLQMTVFTSFPYFSPMTRTFRIMKLKIPLLLVTDASDRILTKWLLLINKEKKYWRKKTTTSNRSAAPICRGFYWNGVVKELIFRCTIFHYFLLLH